jgi:ADP-heptose:LPS heptosyltransferase
MTLPALKPLKELYPGARITFLSCSGALGLLQANPYVDSPITSDVFWFHPGAGLVAYLRLIKELRKRRFDLVIEARGDIRDIFLIAYLSGARRRVSYATGGGGFLLTDIVPYPGVRHRVEYHLDIVRFLGWNADKAYSMDWGVRLSPEDLDCAASLLSEGPGRRGRRVVGIHPGGRKALKSWPPQRYAALADRLVSECGSDVYFTGTPEEKALVDGIMGKMANRGVNLAGRTDVGTLAAVISRLDLFITNDSAPLHMASALKTPTVAVFGPSKSKETGPYGNAHRVVEKEFACRGACDEDVCSHPRHNACMEDVAVDDVFRAATEVLRDANR